MESHPSNFIRLLSLVYLCVTVHPVLAGKCSGKWAIHACFGGNGKRSDPTLTDMEDKVRSNLLRNLLLRGSYQPNTFVDTQNDAQNSVLNDSPSYRHFEDDIPAESPPSVSRLQSMLQLFKLEKKMRREAEGLE
ncbi:uncharacterized protein LOC121372059 [Gigantopelta aegis]|uniref:uncharacterized protein LOC121372059 n=1 Tax=Gigantopelta aegis TaxID=1735272 RepID=UPI001B888F30|nr:uncharacterized protein LOC121372059 [Gigantopelta aegis]